MTMNVSEFSYLWDGSDSKWALLHVNANNAEESPRYLVVDTENKQAKLIENDELQNAVVSKMLESDVRIVSVGNGF